MTCEEYLAALSSAPIALVNQASDARAHFEGCPECSKMLASIEDGERGLGASLDMAKSLIPPTQTAELAIMTAKRRRVGKLAAIGLAVLIAVVFWITAIRVIVPTARETAQIVTSDLVTLTLRLRCMSSSQAGDLISPYVRSDGSAYYIIDGPFITVRAKAPELAKVKSLLAQLDDPSQLNCKVP
ncbi:MAG: hypothetical protein H0U64_03660 [Gemmatimonadaceae bacterium]|nr:hypothetical protein [Gemmatimonadaceae bacterium]